MTAMKMMEHCVLCVISSQVHWQQALCSGLTAMTEVAGYIVCAFETILYPGSIFAKPVPRNNFLTLLL